MQSSLSKKERRHSAILTALADNPAIRVVALAREMNVSTETIRRDLTELQKAGLLNRTYGGAVTAPPGFEPALVERMNMYHAERKAIGMLAAQRLRGERSLLLGGGATVQHFARALRELAQRMTIITPSYPVAAELSANPGIEVHMLPGILEPGEHVVFGPETLRAVRQYAPRAAVIGASGLGPEGISEALLSLGEVYAAIASQAEVTSVLADHSKFDRRALTMVAEWSARLMLFTDRHPADTLAAALHNRGATIEITASPEG
ncbi:MAG: DeoR/GlpR transcriptional regulator [Rhodobacteraceae bacterium]|nr:DeoR/GlpR transcriptional regulator [Paracoccaceae bacterium]